MAWKAFLITIFIAAALAPALGMDYLVEWNLKFNKTQWLDGKEFHVGDTLMFMYTSGDHNVLSVTGDDYKTCNKSAPIKGPFTNGTDTFTFGTLGKRWYICGIATHCDQGMKLVIDVTAEGPAPAPAPWSSATPLKSFAWMVVAAMASFWMLVA